MRIVMRDYGVINMQYILTKEEFDDLLPMRQVLERNAALEDARKIIVKLAGVRCGETYCDNCPISSIGYYEHGDADAISDNSSRLICSEYRDYSK